MSEFRSLADVARHLVAIAARHADVGKNDVGWCRFEALDGLVAIADRHNLDIFFGKRQFDDALNRHAVVGKKQGMRHVSLSVL